VETPHVFKTDLWRESGHYDNYADDMFLFEVGDDEFGLKPMNCPGPRGDLRRHVETPHVFKTDLWRESGHYDNYADDMFLFEVGD
ncbi:hypothetical protein B9D06_22090, partial [Mycobacterium tuberculosis]